MSKLVLSDGGYLEARELCDNLRPEDAIEIDRTNTLPSRLASVVKTMRASLVCKALRDDRGVLLALGGVIPQGNEAMAWVLTTRAVDDNWRDFARYSKKILPVIIEPFSGLYNFVDVEYIKSIRWLMWLGFQTGPVYEMMPSRAPFVKMSLARGKVWGN